TAKSSAPTIGASTPPARRRRENPARNMGFQPVPTTFQNERRHFPLIKNPHEQDARDTSTPPFDSATIVERRRPHMPTANDLLAHTLASSQFMLNRFCDDLTPQEYL